MQPLGSNVSDWPGPREAPPLSRTGFLLLSALMALVTAPAVVLNASVIIVSLRHKRLRQPLNLALINMAAADLGSAMTGGVMSVINNGLGRFALGRSGCVAEGFAVSLFGITSLCTVALVAVERMLVVSKPLGHFSFERKHALVGVALSWLWSLTWNLPPLLGWGRYDLEGVGTSCAPAWNDREPRNVSYILVFFSVCFAVPFTIIVLAYGKLMWTLHKVSRLPALECGAAAAAERKVAIMVLLMVLTFLLSWLPYASLALLVVLRPEAELHPLLATAPVYLAKSSNVYNPIIYIYLNKQFRKYMVPFLLCGRDPEDEDSEAATTVEPAAKVSPTRDAR